MLDHTTATVYDSTQCGAVNVAQLNFSVHFKNATTQATPKRRNTQTATAPSFDASCHATHHAATPSFDANHHCHAVIRRNPPRCHAVIRRDPPRCHVVIRRDPLPTLRAGASESSPSPPSRSNTTSTVRHHRPRQRRRPWRRPRPHPMPGPPHRAPPHSAGLRQEQRQLPLLRFRSRAAAIIKVVPQCRVQ